VVAAAAAAGLVLAGCGGDDEKTTSTAAAPAATTETAAKAPAPTKPDGLEPIARRCSVGKLRAENPDIVPAALRPPKTRVMTAQQASDGYTATLLYDKSVNQIYALLRDQVQSAGYSVVDGESEGFEAELAIQNSSGRTELRISALRDCPQYSRATVRTESAEG